MASPALNTFNAAIDAMSINAANKTIAKGHGATLYVGATQEEAAHIMRHLDAAIITATGETLTRLQAIRDVIDGITTDPAPHTATDVPTYLQPASGPEWTWAQAVLFLLLSKSVAQAERRWDDLAAGGIPAGVQTRLRALRDLITTKLGA